jgi:hypothetical protein
VQKGGKGETRTRIYKIHKDEDLTNKKAQKVPKSLKYPEISFPPFNSFQPTDRKPPSKLLLVLNLESAHLLLELLPCRE